MAFGLYFHVPFCAGRCRYCDFYTRGGYGQVPEAYIKALLRSLEEHRPRDGDGVALRPDTVYFGGGTPGLLTPGQVTELLRAAAPLPGAEVTLEANPEKGLEGHLYGWRRAGVNRLSLGVQSARDASLRRLGRRHTAAEARGALTAAKAAGFENVSGDIMLALPGYSEEEFDETLGLLQEGGAGHISAYLLKLEPGTALGENPPKELPGPDEAADFYLYAVARLEKAGYGQYEISNFARPGKEGRHNLLYWNCEDYLGLGPSAHSCLFGRRFSFPADLEAFLKGEPAPREEGRLDAEDYIMLRLRLREGLSEKALEERFGVALSEGQKEQFAGFARQGFALRRGEAVSLTPRGMLVQNSLLAKLLG